MKKRSQIPVLKVRKNASMREILARARAEFTAADLQKFTEIEPGIPAAKVLARMRTIHAASRIPRK